MDWIFLRRQRALLDDSNSQTRNAYALSCRFFDNIRLPDLRALADVNRRAGANNETFCHGANVIGVDLEADRAEFIGINRHPCGDTP